LARHPQTVSSVVIARREYLRAHAGEEGALTHSLTILQVAPAALALRSRLLATAPVRDDEHASQAKIKVSNAMAVLLGACWRRQG
jgi:hypothetical protein